MTRPLLRKCTEHTWGLIIAVIIVAIIVIKMFRVQMDV